MKRIHIGDILFDGYASETNPIRKSIIIGSDKDHYKVVYFDSDNKMCTCKFYKNDVKNDPKFEILGHIDIKGFLLNGINQFNK